jgi:hypothetical protein
VTAYKQEGTPNGMIIPLLDDYPAVKGLNPEIAHNGEPLIHRAVAVWMDGV